jgi:endonuclease/exonuclease/phosphatase family metal-dependent hydrolase
MSHAIGENRLHDGYGYGNVVLARGCIEGVHNYDLTVRGREERGCLRVDVRLPGTPLLHIFNVHLGTAHMERRHQGRKLVAPELLCDAAFTSPRLVLGDFNEWTKGLATHLLCSHLESADLRSHLRWPRTYPGIFPFLHLDHIYYDRTLHLEKVVWGRTPKALVASDHLPLAADFTWAGEIWRDKKENGSK